MKAETIKLVFTYLIAAGIIGFGMYALVLYPYELSTETKLLISGLMGAATTHVFGEQVAARAAHQAESASALGASQALSTPPGGQG
jgi:hypothetical protein